MKREQTKNRNVKVAVVARAIWDKYFYHFKWSSVAWLIGVYVATFGIASQRYENHRDRIDNKIAIITTQLGTPARKAALERVNELQANMKIPIEPKILVPWTSFFTLFGDKQVSDELMDELKLIVSTSLQSQGSDGQGVLDLNYIDLSSYSDGTPVNLRNANLENTFLVRANLSGSFLYFANLKGSDIRLANFENSNLVGANLDKTFLQDANFKNANIKKASLYGAYTHQSDLQNFSIKSVCEIISVAYNRSSVRIDEESCWK